MACLPMIFCTALGGCFATLKTPAPVSGIAIIVSDNSPAFVGVQREIGKKFPQRVEIFTLGDESKYAAARNKIQSSDLPVIVAIGLPAAQLAQGLSGKKVIFCQVFNYEDTDLVTPWMKGVSATAPVREQFRVWKALHPKLTRVGVITGKNLQGLMEEAQAAAREYQIRLDHVEARSDKEMLYAYKQLSPKIQGLWLVPDNRVLSRDVIRDIMAHSVKEGKQVAVFGRELLGRRTGADTGQAGAGGIRRAGRARYSADPNGHQDQCGDGKAFESENSRDVAGDDLCSVIGNPSASPGLTV
jgi:ABC-type uncharacterized transport system substrate-binding protein